VLRRAGGGAGHVFNLGHGVLPGSPVENLQALVETVHEGVTAANPQLA
jgi:uroporphyrinogen decarboxylase